MRQLYSLIIGMLLLCSCALTHQDLILRPDVNVAKSDIGKGRAVKFKTVDERNSSVVGSRGVKGFASADIVVTTQDATAVIQTTLVDGLKQKGFSPILQEGSFNYGLRVDIRNLEYGITPGIITGTLRTEAVLKATCTVDGKNLYDQMYRGEETDWILVAQFSESNEKYINSALSKAIQNLLDDPKLQECLAQ